VHKKTVMAAVRIPNPQGGERLEIVKQFSTFHRDLRCLGEWMSEHGVTDVAMEATGMYWVPVWRVLEQFEFENLILANPGHIKAVAGRKTDVKDACWIAQLLECGLVPPSFVPPRDIFELRQLTRYRKKTIEGRSREILRVQKLLEDAGIKLDSVISNVMGVSGRQMLDALIAGVRDVDVLAEMSHGKMRNKRDDLKLALEGLFDSHHHAKLLQTHLDCIDAYSATVERLDGDIAVKTTDYANEIKLLMTITGIGLKTAEVVIAEIGADMSRFPTAQHLASWAGMCPGNHESAGKQKSGRARTGCPALRSALVESAWVAARMQDSYFSAQFRRFCRRFGKKSEKKAAFAVAHSLLITIWHVLKHNVEFEDLGTEHFKNVVDNKEILKRRKVKELEALGYVVTCEEAAA
jgi:transposase